MELLVNHEGINLARNTTIVVESWDITPPSPVSANINGKSTKGGVFDETQSVDLSASDDYSIANIYYTRIVFIQPEFETRQDSSSFDRDAGRKARKRPRTGP